MTISSALFVVFILEESRSDAILSKRAARLTKETGQPHTTEFDIANSSRSMVAALKTSCVPIGEQTLTADGSQIFMLTQHGDVRPLADCFAP